MHLFLNGKLVPEAQATISVFDRAFLYGDGLFETLRVSRGRPFQWKEHFERLQRGAAYLKIPLPFTETELLSQAIELISANQMHESVLRLNLSRGIGPRGYSIKGAAHPTTVMTLHPSPTTNESAAPWRLITSSVRLSSSDPLAQFKTCNKLPQILAKAEADAQGADEALLLNERGEILEGSASNLFWFRDGIVCTAPVNSGILPGITRATVLQICGKLGITLREELITPQELQKTDGIFLTLSSRGVVEAGFLDGHAVRLTPLARQIREAHQNFTTNT